MRRVVRVALCFAVPLVASATMCSSALAWQPPFWKVQCHKVSEEHSKTGLWNDKACTEKSEAGEGEYALDLLTNETRSFRSYSNKVVLHTGTVGEVECEGSTGSGELVGKYPGEGTEELTLKGCSVVGNAACHVSSLGSSNSETILITNLTMTLVFLNKEIGNAIGETIRPEAGSVLVELVYAPSGSCPITSAKLEGETAGTFLKPGEESYSKTINLPEVPIERCWEGATEPLTERTFKLEFFDGSAFKASLRIEQHIELEPKEAWSVTTEVT